MRFLMKRLVITAAVAITLGLPAVASAGQYEDGLSAYNRQDFKAVVKLWHSAGEDGDVNAEYHLGSMYFDGRGVKKDYAEAMKWLHMAAESRACGGAESYRIHV